MTKTYPRLRPIDFQPIYHQGQKMWLLRDPWELTERQLIFPQALAPLLYYCDGTRTVEAIQAAFSARAGETVPIDMVHNALSALDEACLLVNERSRMAINTALAQYRAQAYRPPALANLGYPGKPAELSAHFQRFASPNEANARTNWKGRGIVSPHIDYPRGGPVYAQVWQQAIPSILDADLVIILGTDHNGSPGSITLTRLPYATPFGVLPTDAMLVDALAGALGEEAAFAEELNHKGEHSVELSAVWLHYVYEKTGQRPRPMVPILTGSFFHHIANGTHPAGDAKLTRFLNTLQEQTANRRVLFVASVDLAHVGPQFGDHFSMDADRREQLKTEDETVIQAVLQGNAASFYQLIASVEDRNRICGFSPLYIMLRTLEETEGIEVAYQHCPADNTNTSLVSICGLLLK